MYGDPAIARIDGDHLVVLGGDVVPERRRDLEHDLLLRLRDRLNLVPGRRVHFDGAEAAQMAAKLREWQATEGGAPLGEAGQLRARIISEGERFDVAVPAAHWWDDIAHT